MFRAPGHVRPLQFLSVHRQLCFRRVTHHFQLLHPLGAVYVRNRLRHQRQPTCGLLYPERYRGYCRRIKTWINGMYSIRMSLSQTYIGSSYTKCARLDPFRSLDYRAQGSPGGARAGKSMSVAAVVHNYNSLGGGVWLLTMPDCQLKLEVITGNRGSRLSWLPLRRRGAVARRP